MTNKAQQVAVWQARLENTTIEQMAWQELFKNEWNKSDMEFMAGKIQRLKIQRRAIRAAIAAINIENLPAR